MPYKHAESAYHRRADTAVGVRGFIVNIRSATAVLLMFSMTACATPVQLVVDPHSISDRPKYDSDTAECRSLSDSYQGNGAATAGAAVIGGTAAGLGAALAVGVATGGLLILPMAAVAAVGGGGMMGGAHEQNKVNRSRENILVQCMNDRGYKAFSPNAK